MCVRVRVRVRARARVRVCVCVCARAYACVRAGKQTCGQGLSARVELVVTSRAAAGMVERGGGNQLICSIYFIQSVVKRVSVQTWNRPLPCTHTYIYAAAAGMSGKGGLLCSILLQSSSKDDGI